MLNCIIIDDERAAIDVLSNYVNRLPQLNLLATFTSPVEALELIRTQSVDLAFVDIRMPELSGIELMKLAGSRCRFIITTAYEEYALEGYQYHNIDYLVKPVPFERFVRAIDKTQSILRRSTESERSGTADDYVFIKTESRIQKIELNDILFVEGLGNYVTVHTTRGKFVSLLNVKDLEEALSPDLFLRVHRSYIISLGKIDFVEGNQIFLDNETSIPLGDTYRNQLWAALDKKIITGRK
ncbi:LytR/AlgR family response regulator transcription factor [Flectobacillus roseus]|jgi:DNA-binding LytR/AlgR family response regulator|uniref:LytTR family DNA-binding domain-containing protein n=1 Tax=Flectobacillus roseus TaxID=502259 RepID=A0ABT6YC51_9BACT|nr:LytTR family DNA-binding domain-containing protein [Flectobacillus roseus]MDI9861120.1 LytTR family DNA-binding domain-containing protein [Flectobacillus roseus]MDI9872401.1 LytTR family DNA-binding domain-containing protein [Flectobacillus roseus]NBA76784.1 response regulator [Emticicia sp. ODNR4P]